SLTWPPERVRALEEALTFVKWQPKVDWLYRQYLVGVGETATEAESRVGKVLGAAGGWVDRPFAEDGIAELIVRVALRQSSKVTPTTFQPAWVALPAALHTGDREGVGKALRECADPAEDAVRAIDMIRRHVAAGGSPIEGKSPRGGEGWHNNPAYFGAD